MTHHRRMASTDDVRKIGNLRPVSPENEGSAWWGVRELPTWEPSSAKATEGREPQKPKESRDEKPET